MPPQIYDITPNVGSSKDNEPTVISLAAVVVKTVSMETWLAMGGKGTLQGFYNANESVKKWFLVVNNDATGVQAAVKALLDGLK